MTKDVYGKGLMAYWKGDKTATFTVESDLAETEEWPVAEFFHSFDDMAPIERRALSLCHGRTLDVGAGSGCHTLWLQTHGVEAEALDISPLAAEVMKEQGVKNCRCEDFFAIDTTNGPKYDTLLMLMNGVGLCGTIDNLEAFLQRCKSLLAQGGQVLLDSSDLIYLYEEEDGSFSLPLDGYYGELEYTFGFGGEQGDAFPWVFVDFGSLSEAAERCGLKCEVVEEGEHFDYLARLTVKE